MSQITRVPQGLQKFVGSQNFGDNPSELAQTVNPGLDMSMFYGLRNRYWANDAFSFTVDATNNWTEVPIGEIWVAKAVAVDLRASGTSINDQIQLSITVDNMIQSSNGPAQHPLSDFELYKDEIGGGSPYGKTFLTSLPDIPLFPGAQIRTTASQTVVTAGDFNGTSWLHYLRLQV